MVFFFGDHISKKTIKVTVPHVMATQKTKIAATVPHVTVIQKRDHKNYSSVCNGHPEKTIKSYISGLLIRINTVKKWK